MQIFITLLPGGRKITAEVEGTDSVEALRRQIHELASPLLGAAAGSAAPEQQLLLFNEGVLEDGYQFRVIAELFHAERTSHHKTWHSVFVALREELAGLFENIVKVDEASGDTAANRRSNLNRSLGRLIGGLPFSFQLLHVVAFGDFPMLLHLLWVRGGMPLMNAVGAKGETPLCVTVIKNQPGSADRLLRLGAHVDGPRALGLSTYTPLMWAARCGHVDVAKVLLRHNASAARCPYFANNLPSNVAVHYKHFGLALVLKRYESEQERRLADGADA